FLSLDIPHLSAYALTVEHQTALQYFIKKGKVKSPEDDKALADYKLLIEFMKTNGFNHYEISNFARSDYHAVHNTAYWQGKPYIGIGPSAHSYNGDQRRWNVAHNSKYIKALNTGVVPYEQEDLSVNDRLNEYLMTGLRTVWGVDLKMISHKFGEKYHRYLLAQLASRKDHEHFVVDNNHLKLTETGLFFADGIIADLFYVD
ncbi:MAG: coproporphyrinogen III oxidase, partial [Flavobacteriia bacterium]